MNENSLQKKIFKYLIENKNLFHVISRNVTEISDNSLDYIWDIGIKGTRDKEDKLFNRNTEIKNILRRGLSLGIKISPEYKLKYKNIPWYQYELEYVNIWILKRGFQKFDDLSPYHNKRLNQIDHIKHNCKTLDLIATEKLDGENSQISFFEVTNQWIIGSKNVTLLCKDKSELESKIYNENRYKAVKNIAYNWFQILEKFKIKYEEEFCEQLNYLKIFLNDKTLIGELICDTNRQHIINYSMNETKLYFIGIVSKINDSDICYNPKFLKTSLHPFFNDYIVKFINLPSNDELDQYFEQGLLNEYKILSSKSNLIKNNHIEFRNIQDIYKYLNILQFLIFSSKEDLEGLVLYFLKKSNDIDEEKVLDIFKIKTLKYINLRLLRERLRNLIIKEISLIIPSNYGKFSNKIISNNSQDSKTSIEYLNNEDSIKVIHDFLTLRLPIISEIFFKKLIHSSMQTYQALCNEKKFCEKKFQEQFFDEIYKIKLLFEDSSIFIVSIILYNQTINNIDYIQVSREFFNQYTSFISEIEKKYSNMNILTNIKDINYNSNIINKDKTNQIMNFPSGSFLEFSLPPFIIKWQDLKKLLSEDFSINEDSWILNNNICYLTGKEIKNYNSDYYNDKYHIFVTINHTKNECISLNENQFIINYKLKINENSHSEDLKKLKSTNIQYKRPLIGYSSEKWQNMRDILRKYIDHIDHIQKKDNDLNLTDSSLTQNKIIIKKLQHLSNLMPWNNQEISKNLPDDYVLNKRDFEHLVYSLVALNNLDYVINAFYSSELNNQFFGIQNSNNKDKKKILNKIECTLLLPSGIPGSGKSMLLRNFLYKQSIKNNCIHSEALLTNGKSIENLNTDEEFVYSILIHSNKNNENSSNFKINKIEDEFDIILYVSSDGCTSRLSKGYKWNYKNISNSLNFLTNNDINNNNNNDSNNINNNDSDKNINFEIDTSSLNNKKFKKLYNNSRKSMKFIIEFVLKQCLYLIEISENNFQNNIVDQKEDKIEFSPNWYKKLFKLYNLNKRLKVLLLIDMNHTPQLLSNISKSFESNFLLNELILYRVLVIIIPQLFHQKNEQWPYIWSKEVLIKCILRIAKRNNNSTLKGLSLHSLNIILGFFVLYSKSVSFNNNFNNNTNNNNPNNSNNNNNNNNNNNTINNNSNNNIQSSESFYSLKLSSELVKALNFEGSIILDNEDDILLQNNSEDKQLIDEIYSQFISILKHINLFSTNKEDKNLNKLLNNIEKLSNKIKFNVDNNIDKILDEFTNNLEKLIKEIPPKNYYENKQTLINKNNYDKINYWDYLSNNEIQNFIQTIQKKFIFAGVLFKDEISNNNIIDVWNNNKDYFKVFQDLDSNNITINKENIDMPEIEPGNKHLTCFFFGGPHNSHNNKIENNTDLLKQTISELNILLSKPYVGKSYQFQAIYLVYVPFWKLSFLILSSYSKIFEVPNIDKFTDIEIKDEFSNGLKNINYSSKINNLNQKNNNLAYKCSNSQYFNFKSFILPFRKNGIMHITLFSEIFEPVISNIAASLLGNNFSRLNNKQLCQGIYNLEIKVNEESLKNFLKKNSNYQISNQRNLKVLVKNIWDKKINLKGDLLYM